MSVRTRVCGYECGFVIASADVCEHMYVVVSVGTCMSVITSHSLVCKAYYFFCDLHANLRASWFSTRDPEDILLRSK